MVDVSDRTVKRIVSSLKGNNEHNENHRRNCGCKRKTSVRIDRKIVNEALKNRRANSQEIQNAISRVGQADSISTVKRRWYESSLKYRRPIKRPFLKARLISKRLTSPKEHEFSTVDQWKKVSNNFIAFSLNLNSYFLIVISYRFSLLMNQHCSTWLILIISCSDVLMKNIYLNAHKNC